MSSASDERNVTVKMYKRKIHGDYHAESAIDREIRRYHLIRNISCLVTFPFIFLLCIEQYFIISEWNEIGTEVTLDLSKSNVNLPEPGNFVKLNLSVIHGPESSNEVAFESTLEGGAVNDTNMCYLPVLNSNLYLEYRIVRGFSLVQKVSLLLPPDRWFDHTIYVQICSHPLCLNRKLCESQWPRDTFQWHHFSCGHPGNVITIDINPTQAVCQVELTGKAVE
ncbi:uncharacterized protein LOC142341242 [Convolutriloba macropyga]|uniref:uncharacterized protein LOC142341242 n=1 Tax=Convolutriloba macropyga TaxID=536237 RepID=UPI003F51EA2F